MSTEKRGKGGQKSATAGHFDDKTRTSRHQAHSSTFMGRNHGSRAAEALRPISREGHSLTCRKLNRNKMFNLNKLSCTVLLTVLLT